MYAPPAGGLATPESLTYSVVDGRGGRSTATVVLNASDALANDGTPEAKTTSLCGSYAKRDAVGNLLAWLHNLSQGLSKILRFYGSCSEWTHTKCEIIATMGAEAAPLSTDNPKEGNLVSSVRAKWSTGRYTDVYCNGGWQYASNEVATCDNTVNIGDGTASCIKKLKWVFTYAQGVDTSAAFATRHLTCTTHVHGSGSSSCSAGNGAGPGRF